LGLHFQDTTIIAVGAVVAAVVALLVYDNWAVVEGYVRRRPIVTLVVLGLAALLGLVAVERLGLFDQLGTLALWASSNAKRYQFYLVAFRDDLPLLWPLLPVASALALARPAQRRLAIFCIVAIVCGLLVHSVAAQKSVRYVYYLVPLLCVLWALGFANLMAIVAERTLPSGTREVHRIGLAAWALLAAAFLLSQEGARALNLLAARDGNSDERPYADEPDWTPLLAELGPRARAADFVVTSNSMKALYYLGRYDYELNATIVPETDTREEFGLDRRTGRRAIGTAESIGRVLSGPGDGLVVIEASKIGRPSGVNREAFAVIESRCAELRLPAGASVRAWWCVAPRTERDAQLP
jgi:hypothetical protein